MPVVAVGLAVALDVGAISAAISGTLMMTAAITAIGATVSAIGAVTHNKTLSMIGMGIGIVGVVGSLASGAGLFDNVTDLFGSGQMSAADAASLGADATAASDAAVASLPGAAGAGVSGAADITTALGGINPSAVNPVGAINATSAAAEGNAAAIETGGQSGGALAGSLSPGAADAASSSLPGVTKMFDDSMLTKFMPGMPTISADSIAPGGLMDWAHNNQMVTYGAIQAGGSLISGLTNPMTPAQIDSLNSQSEVNRATAELLKRQMANQAAPLPTATVATPAITGRVEQPGGLINNTAPVGTALITGAPNTGTAATKPMGTV